MWGESYQQKTRPIMNELRLVPYAIRRVRSVNASMGVCDMVSCKGRNLSYPSARATSDGGTIALAQSM
jgi:hypothetical protein